MLSGSGEISRAKTNEEKEVDIRGEDVSFPLLSCSVTCVLNSSPTISSSFFNQLMVLSLPSSYSLSSLAFSFNPRRNNQGKKEMVGWKQWEYMEAGDNKGREV